MIQKKTLVELVQVKVAGGNLPADTRRVVHPRTIETEIGVVISDLIASNPSMAEAMARTITITTTTTAPYTGTLPYSLITPNGVYSITSGNKNFNIVTPYDFVQMPKYNPGIALVKTEGTTATFTECPEYIDGVPTVSFVAIPNFRELPQDGLVILEEMESQLVDMVAKRLMPNAIQELENDSRRDGQNR